MIRKRLYTEEDIRMMNKKEVEKAIDEIMERKNDVMWEIVDIQFVECELFERSDELEKVK